MGLPKEFADALDAGVEKKTITLPKSGIPIEVHGMLLGEYTRVNATKEETRLQVMIAMAAHDPKTGKPYWNPNDLNDIQQIGKLKKADFEFLVETVEELSDLEEDSEGNAEVVPTTISSALSFGSGSEDALLPRQSAA